MSTEAACIDDDIAGTYGLRSGRQGASIDDDAVRSLPLRRTSGDCKDGIHDGSGKVVADYGIDMDSCRTKDSGTGEQRGCNCG
jgi:hypothetical protein